MNKTLVGVVNFGLVLSVYVRNAFPEVKAENIIWTNSTSGDIFNTGTNLSSPEAFYQSYDSMKMVASLLVKNISLESGGGYRCTATNEAGSGSEVVVVSIQGIALS